MIDFDINPKALILATKRIKEYNRRNKQLQMCLNSLVCPKCAGKLEKRIDDNRNILRVCLNSDCGFTWPTPPEELKFHVEKSDPDVKTYSGPGIGAKTSLNRFIERIG